MGLSFENASDKYLISLLLRLPPLSPFGVVWVWVWVRSSESGVGGSDESRDEESELGLWSSSGHERFVSAAEEDDSTLTPAFSATAMIGHKEVNLRHKLRALPISASKYKTKLRNRRIVKTKHKREKRERGMWIDTKPETYRWFSINVRKPQLYINQPQEPLDTKQLKKKRVLRETRDWYFVFVYWYFFLHFLYTDIYFYIFYISRNITNCIKNTWTESVNMIIFGINIWICFKYICYLNIFRFLYTS